MRVRLRALLGAVASRGLVVAIARRLGVSSSTARKHLRRARSLGYVTCTPTIYGDYWELGRRGRAARRGLGRPPECPRCCTRAEPRRSRGGWLRCTADGCGATRRASTLEADSTQLSQPKGRTQLDMFGAAVSS